MFVGAILIKMCERDFTKTKQNSDNNNNITKKRKGKKKVYV